MLADTFLVAWRRRAEIPDPALPWLYGVCLRTISTHRRSGRRRARLWGRLSSHPQESGRDPADVHAARSEINRAFAQLSEGERETLRLVAWDGLSTEDAANVARDHARGVSRPLPSCPTGDRETSGRRRP